MPCPDLTVEQAAQLMRDGGVVAYPTEAVYGLGCDPLDHEAVLRILELKARPESAGLILIADDYAGLAEFVGEVDPAALERAAHTWPGPTTWLFPRSPQVPAWISGEHDSVAIRVSDHPVCRQLCAAFGGAIVSTSANRSGEAPARSKQEVAASFAAGIAGIVRGELGGRARPSEIRDVLTGDVIRPA